MHRIRYIGIQEVFTIGVLKFLYFVDYRCLCCFMFLCAGDGKGDACATDYDGDGVKDSADPCPANALIEKTSFSNAIEVPLDKSEMRLLWSVISVSASVVIKFVIRLVTQSSDG